MSHIQYKCIPYKLYSTYIKIKPKLILLAVNLSLIFLMYKSEVYVARDQLPT